MKGYKNYRIIYEVPIRTWKLDTDEADLVNIIAEAKKLFCPKLSKNCIANECVCYKLETREDSCETDRKVTERYRSSCYLGLSHQDEERGVTTYISRTYAQARCTFFKNNLSSEKVISVGTWKKDWDTKDVSSPCG